MMSWIAAIQANNNPDEDVSVFFVTNGTRTNHGFSAGFVWLYKVVDFQKTLQSNQSNQTWTKINYDSCILH